MLFERRLIAAHESENGPLSHFAAAQQPRRFRSEADIAWQGKAADKVENDL
jgi:hypothetical protein